MLLVATLSLIEITVLRAYATAALPIDTAPHERVEWATATQALIERGMLARVQRGILVTPEGLAAVLDTVPVSLMQTPSPVGATSAVRQGAPTRPSRAKRTSAESSLPRSPAPN